MESISGTWRVNEALESLLQMQDNEDAVDGAKRHDDDHNEGMQDLDTFSSPSISTPNETQPSQNRSDIRRALQKLDSALGYIIDELTGGSIGDSGSDSGSSFQSSHTDNSPATLRESLLNILTKIDLNNLGIDHKDTQLHGLFWSVCQKTENSLLRFFFLSDQESYLEPHEAVKALDRILLTLQDECLVGRLSEGETMRIGVLLRLLNHALFVLLGRGDEMGNESSNSCHSPQEPTKTLLEEMFDGPLCENILDVLRLFSFAAENGLDDKAHLPQLHKDTLDSTMTCLDFVFAHVDQKMKQQQSSTLHDYIQLLATQSRLDKNDALDTERQVESYTTELLESALDAIARATETCTEQANESPVTFQTDDDVDAIFEESVKYAKLACTTLRLTAGSRPATGQRISNSSRSLWIAYTQFFLAGANFNAPIHRLCFATDTFLHLGVLALDESNLEDGFLLDDELHHALSLTMLAATEFPDVMIKHNKFWNIIEVSVKADAEFRHLVQGVALRGLLLPMSGTERDTASVPEVQQKLTNICIASAYAQEELSEEDPWNVFFLDQLAKHCQLNAHSDAHDATCVNSGN